MYTLYTCLHELNIILFTKNGKPLEIRPVRMYSTLCPKVPIIFSSLACTVHVQYIVQAPDTLVNELLGDLGSSGDFHWSSDLAAMGADALQRSEVKTEYGEKNSV